MFPEASYGTHFFQDLVEAEIFPLILYPQDPETIFDAEFFRRTRNVLAELLPNDAEYADYIKVIDVQAATAKLLEVIMNGEQEEALGYLRTYPQEGA